MPHVTRTSSPPGVLSATRWVTPFIMSTTTPHLVPRSFIACDAKSFIDYNERIKTSRRKAIKRPFQLNKFVK